MIAVEISEHDAARRLHESAGLEVLAHETAELERHPIGVGELQVGNVLGDLGGARGGLREALPVEGREPHEAGPAPRRDLGGRIVAGEEMRLVVGIERDQAGNPPRHADVPGQRPVLGERKLEPPLERRQPHRHGDHPEGGQCEHGGAEFHRISVYPRRITGP